MFRVREFRGQGSGVLARQSFFNGRGGGGGEKLTFWIYTEYHKKRFRVTYSTYYFRRLQLGEPA